MDALKGFYEKAKAAVVGPTQDAVAPIQQQIPAVTTQGGAVKMGMGKEPTGYTSAGGRRVKTRSASKRKGGRKTRSKRVRKH